MSAALRWGIMGAGWIAARFAADLRYGAGGVLTRVASRDPARATALAAPYGAQVSDSYGALVAADDIDAIYIATPASLHRDHCLLALAQGKPVLCEKPFATTAAEAREIAAAAAEAGVFCMEAMWTRFMPLMGELRQRVAAGALGEVAQFSAELGFPTEESDTTLAITSPALGGGALLDLGIYGLSMAHDLLGPPDSIAAEALYAPSGSLRDVAITLRHAHGGQPVLASVRASQSTQLSNRLQVAGSLGQITVDAPFIQAHWASQTRVSAAGRSAEAPSALKDALRASPIWPMARSLVRRLRQDRFGQTVRGYGLRFEAEEVARCLAAGHRESAVMPLAASVSVLETVDKIRELIAPPASPEV